MIPKIPETFLDLVDGPRVAALSTIMPDGQPQTTVVWCDYDGESACVNTTLEHQKGRNLSANPKATLLVVDPEDTARYIEIRGEMDLVQAGALEHLDELTRQYTKHPSYYGHIYPVEQQAKETRIICRLNAKKITLDAIHK
jgi:PPOX class probable F420-dependent enzyme